MREQRTSSRGPRVRRGRKLAIRTGRAIRFSLGSAFGHRRYEYFALVGHPRTGSNYVLGGLASSRAVRMYDELFAAHSRKNGQSVEQVMHALRVRQARSIRIVGFKVFYNHLREDEWPRLSELPLRRVVHLTRRNRLRTLVSLDIAISTGRWTGTSRRLTLDNRRVRLDPATVVGRLDEIAAGENRARRRFDSPDRLEVVYEDVTADPAREFARIGAFLGIEDIDYSRILLPRQNPEPLLELIVNLDEVAAQLADTPYAPDLAG